MENHPIPQDVTGFQFRLIGDMTVKQFAYLAVGVVLGWLSLIIPGESPLMLFIKLPLAAFFFGGGAALAFLPIEGRPMDLMVSHFMQALFTPNQYVYQKMGRQIFPPTAQMKQTFVLQPTTQPQQAKNLEAFLQTVHTQSKAPLDTKEATFMQSLFPSTQPMLQPMQQPTTQQSQQMAPPMPFTITLPQAPTPTMTIEQQQQPQQKKTEHKEKPEKKDTREQEMLQKEIEQLKKMLQETQTQAAQQQQALTQNDVQQKITEMANNLNMAMAEKQQLEQQLVNLKKDFDTKQQTFVPGQQAQTTQFVKKIAKQEGVKTGAPIMPDVANLIAGVIKDSRGNILPNILIEIKDKEENPVRAFKTNTLGQFASATPLANGTYTIEFEDPKGMHKFDTVELSVTGVILSPLEVISTDAREELRKSLFNT